MQGNKDHPQVHVCRRIVWLNSKSAPVMRLCFVQPPIGLKCNAEVRLGRRSHEVRRQQRQVSDNQ